MGACDRVFSDERVAFAAEPPEMEGAFRKLTSGDGSSPKAWADAYLAAFADQLRAQIVTFDKALAGKGHGRAAAIVGAPAASQVKCDGRISSSLCSRSQSFACTNPSFCRLESVRRTQAIWRRSHRDGWVRSV
jgi:hypothetical protein